jgi:hypothetical protein
MTDLTPALQFLVGAPVSGVCFVQDYVELHFDGSYLRCLAAPAVTDGGACWVFPGSGSRDALCSLIGRELAAVRAEDGAALVAEFRGGAVLRLSLDHEGRAGPEAVHFHDHATGETQFW